MCVRSRASVQNSSSDRKQSPAKLAIEFDMLRRRPRRDSHGTCRLSGDVQPPSWPMTTPSANGQVNAYQETSVYASQLELKWLTKWLSCSWES